MSFLRPSSPNESIAVRAPRAPRDIDLAPGEWEEVDTRDLPVDAEFGMHTIASFWLIAAFLVLLIDAAPALEAAAFHFK